MNFCSQCGGSIERRIPPGDNLPRYVCAQCGAIHYENPKLVVGALPQWGDKVLLCRRAIEPRYGLWTLPAGFMGNGETTAQAAIRETTEEACARIELTGLYTLFNVVHINQVHLVYRARLLDLDFAPGVESLEVRLFEEPEIPWEQLAFRSIRKTLEHFFADRRNGAFGFHSGDIALPMRPPAISEIQASRK